MSSQRHGPLAGRRIVLLDAEQRSALAALRAIGRAGADVVAVSSADSAIGHRSKFAAHTARTVNPLTSPESYVTEVVRIAAEYDAEMVMPCSEQSIAALVTHQLTLPPPFALPDARTYEWASDKEAVLATAKASGISTPAQILLETPDATGIPAAAYPAVLKPARSIKGGSRHAVQYANTPDQCAALLATLPPDAFPVLFQQRITGYGQGVFLFRWQGQIIARFAHERLREVPITGGAAVACVSVPLSDAPVEQSEALLHQIGWEGVAMVEWKRSLTDGTPYLMEINPRFWGSLQLAIDAGVNFPVLWACAFLGIPVEPQVTYSIGRASRTVLGEFDWMLALRRFGATSIIAGRQPSLTRPAPLALLSPLLRTGFDTLQFSDPGPFLQECKNWINVRRR